MKALHYTTASIFSADYRCYGSLAADDRHWRSTACAAADLITQVSPSRLSPRDGLGLLDPQLGGRVQLKVLIERSADWRQWCLAATAAGMGSATRADFTGRRIRDAIHITACGAFDDPAALQEAIQAVRGIWRLAHDPSLSLDRWCCQEAFEQDRIPFPPAADLWAHLVEAGARPLLQPGAAGRESMAARQPRPPRGEDWHEPPHQPERSPHSRALPCLLQGLLARVASVLPQTLQRRVGHWFPWWPFQLERRRPAPPSPTRQAPRRPGEPRTGQLRAGTQPTDEPCSPQPTAQQPSVRQQPLGRPQPLRHSVDRDPVAPPGSDDHDAAMPPLERVLRQLQQGYLSERRVLL